MQPRSLGVGLALAALVILAGCSAFGTAGPSTGDRTVTPAPVPTPEPSPPPGVTTNGVRDPERLGAVHERHLTNRSYTVTVVRTIRFANGTTVRRLERGRTVGTDGAIAAWTHGRRSEQVDNETIVSRRVWSNESVRVLRLRYANGTTEYTVSQSRQRYPYRRTGNAVARILSSEDADVVAVDTDTDPSTYTLLSRNLTGQRSAAADLKRVETSSIRAVVTDAGLIRHASIRYTGTRDGAPAVTNSTVSFDTTPKTVTRPAWVETALEQRDQESGERTQAAG